MIQDIEPRIFALSESDRADLAYRLLSSLPAILSDSDEGVREALSREASAEKTPNDCLTLEKFTQGIALLRARTSLRQSESDACLQTQRWSAFRSAPSLKPA